MTVDSHQHFWKYSAEQFAWIDDSMSCIRRDFLPEDLEPLTRDAGIDSVISVQARTSLEETRWLLETADEHQWITGVVGWLPLASPALNYALDGFGGHRKLVGAREVMQGREPGALLERRFNEGVSFLQERGLTYDLLIFANQLEEAAAFVDRHPDLTIILDHIAKPRIRDGRLKKWAKQMQEIAKRPNLYCKISGMVTEADFTSWSADQLKPYFDTAVEAFTPARLMFGSDWPVCLVGTGYTSWTGLVRNWTSGWSDYERADLFGATAQRAYQLPT